MQIRVEEAFVPQAHHLGAAYLKSFPPVSKYFHYSPYEETSYRDRLKDIEHRSFDRPQLARVIRDYMSKWGISNEVEEQLDRLQEKNSVVVLGGQQAGLLTGPIYTIHKAITVILTAKQQEQLLGVPVIPVFWVAGEDHDWLEVNHTYLPRKEGAYLNKLTLDDESTSQKVSVAHREINKSDLQAWLDHFFEQQIETEFTGELYTGLCQAIHQSDTYVDFFVAIMHDYFARFGLLMIQSADPEFRKCQSPIFRQVIEHYDEIDQDVRAMSEQMEADGYTPQVQLGQHPALLFIYEAGERLLLEKERDSFRTKDGRFHYSQEQLIQIAIEQPWRLSNNVITRPFMQESLFPTLAFVGGLGEISYWALYKKYFERFHMKCPIIVPRISITIIEKPIAKILSKRDIPIEKVFSGFEEFRKKWLEEKDELQLEQTFEDTKTNIQDLYQPLIEKVKQIDPGLEALGKKNQDKLVEQVEYFQKRSLAAYKAQHEAALRQFDKVEQALYPQQTLQERMYNPFFFFNKHGQELVEVLINHNLKANGKHKMITLHSK